MSLGNGPTRLMGEAGAADARVVRPALSYLGQAWGAGGVGGRGWLAQDRCLSRLICYAILRGVVLNGGPAALGRLWEMPLPQGLHVKMASQNSR